MPEEGCQGSREQGLGPALRTPAFSGSVEENEHTEGTAGETRDAGRESCRERGVMHGESCRERGVMHGESCRECGVMHGGHRKNEFQAGHLAFLRKRGQER